MLTDLWRFNAMHAHIMYALANQPTSCSPAVCTTTLYMRRLTQCMPMAMTYMPIRVQWFSLFFIILGMSHLPSFPWGQRVQKMYKKTSFSSAVLSDFFSTFSKICIFPNFSKLIFKVSIKQIFTKFSRNHLW
jgi:hypothetical protein